MRLGKLLPFMFCFLIISCYMESICCILFGNTCIQGSIIIPYTRFSWFVAKYIEYDYFVIFILFVLGVALETCIYNKLSTLYLFIQILEKSYFENVELYEEQAILLALANIIVCIFLIYKGIKRL